MKNRQLFAFLIIWFSLGIIASFYTGSIGGPMIIGFFLLIAISVIIMELFARFGFSSIFAARRRSRNAKGLDDLSQMTFYVKDASRGKPYGRREIAKILREALLTQTLGFERFPRSSIATAGGDQAIAQILKSRDSFELYDVFLLPEISKEDSSSSIHSFRRQDYLSKISRALLLFEDENPKSGAN
jgi:hypothetical protein